MTVIPWLKNVAKTADKQKPGLKLNFFSNIIKRVKYYFACIINIKDVIIK